MKVADKVRQFPLICLRVKLQAVYQVTVLLIFNFAGRSILRLKHDSRDHAERVKNTFIFNTFVLCQVSQLACLRILVELGLAYIPLRS